MQRATAGLFSDPQLLTDVAGVKPDWAAGTPAAHYTLHGLELLSEAIAPAIRALRLMGFQILECEFTDLAGLGADDPSDTAIQSCSILCDGSQAYHELPADVQLLSDHLASDYVVRLFARPYAPKATTAPAYSLGLNNPTGTEWSLAGGRPGDGQGSVALTLWVDPVEHPAGQVPTPATAIGLRAVPGFVDAVIPVLASLFPAAQPADTSPEAAPAIGQTGLLWLLDPRSWYADTVFDAVSHARAIRKAALRALPAQSTANADIQLYLRALIYGTENLRKSLKSVTGAPIQSFFKAGDFRRAIMRWNGAEVPSFEPLAKGQISATRNMAWLDLIFWLVETKISTCPYLDSGTPFQAPEVVPDLEPLIARTNPYDAMTVDLLHTCMGVYDDEAEYGLICRIQAIPMPLIETEDVYTNPPASSGQWPQRPLETMFTWEYVPLAPPDATPPDVATSEPLPAAERPVEQQKPKLLIVAGPGVSIVQVAQDTVDIVIMRKSDYGFPPWGEPIKPQELYRPYFLPFAPAPMDPEDEAWAENSPANPEGTDPDQDTDSDVDTDTDDDVSDLILTTDVWPDDYYLTEGVHVSERPDGVTYSAFLDVYVHKETGQPRDLSGGPWARFDIRYADLTDGTAGYRADFDYVTYHTDEPGFFDGQRRPMLRIMATPPPTDSAGRTLPRRINFAAGQSWYEAFDVDLREHDDIATIHRNWPHMVPIPEREIRFVDPLFEPSEVPDEDELAYHRAVPVAAVTSFDATRLPMVSEAELSAADFRHSLADQTTIPTEYIASWIDFWLIIPDLILGLHPASIAIDIAEFAYAYNTGLDRYGRPITNQDLFLMGVGIGLPLSGNALTTIRKSLVASKAVWNPASDIARRANDLPVDQAIDTARGMMDDLSEAGNTLAADRAAQEAFERSVGRVTTAANILLNVGGAFVQPGSVPQNYEIANLLSASGHEVIDPGTSYHYRRWLLDTLITQSIRLNPLGGS
ncbi:hypothetical protein [uncultured Tateyamaria sp.]|uniref:hypothetical protein n=1 Tax=Tateyamaria sp. 1078 TaxID=3417464 RepID=UPI002628684E|nr:hypothetical protein [uncultured Tateyamaria sp.]